MSKMRITRTERLKIARRMRLAGDLQGALRVADGKGKGPDLKVIRELLENQDENHYRDEAKPNAAPIVDPAVQAEGEYHEAVHGVLTYLNRLLRKDIPAFLKKKYPKLDSAVVVNGVVSSVVAHGNKAISGNPEVAESKKWLPNQERLQNNSVNKAQQEVSKRRDNRDDVRELSEDSESGASRRSLSGKLVRKAHRLLKKVYPHAQLRSGGPTQQGENQVWYLNAYIYPKDSKHEDEYKVYNFTISANLDTLTIKAVSEREEGSSGKDKVLYKKSGPHHDIDMNASMIKAIHAIDMDFKAYEEENVPTSEEKSPDTEDNTGDSPIVDLEEEDKVTSEEERPAKKTVKNRNKPTMPGRDTVVEKKERKRSPTKVVKRDKGHSVWSRITAGMEASVKALRKEYPQYDMELHDKTTKDEKRREWLLTVENEEDSANPVFVAMRVTSDGDRCTISAGDYIAKKRLFEVTHADNDLVEVENCVRFMMEETRKALNEVAPEKSKDTPRARKETSTTPKETKSATDQIRHILRERAKYAENRYTKLHTVDLMKAVKKKDKFDIHSVELVSERGEGSVEVLLSKDSAVIVRSTYMSHVTDKKLKKDFYESGRFDVDAVTDGVKSAMSWIAGLLNRG